ncbi:mextli [Carabus blaptoides fortunei]
MATSIGISARLSRSSKKQELPYAFNSSSTALVSKLRQDGQLNTVENVMHAIEQVSSLLTSGFDGQIKDSILNMCQHLKVYGACLEILYKEQLDRAFVVFRNSSQDEDKLDYQSRLHLLELIELRANQWKGTDLMSQYYKKKSHNDNDIVSLNDSITSTLTLDSPAFLSPISAPLLGPGEIMKCSGKFTKPTRIPGKNYCKDEVVIRNADSGKVMGIKGRRVHMIEELSETIISFQRVNPGAKERLVQITGASESSINHAKQLIEDTIRRNASPMRESTAGVGARAGSSSSINSSASDECAGGVGGGGPLNSGRGTLMHSLSTGDAPVTEFMYSLHVKQHTLKITGTSLDLVRMSKLVLDEFFSGEPLNGGTAGEFYNFETLPRSPVSPLETNDAETFDAVTNGQSDEQTQISTAAEPTAVNYKPLRRPNLSGDEQVTNINTGSQDDELADAQIKDSGRLVYGVGYLTRMSLSPMSVQPPVDWPRISNEHPYIVRKVVEIFDVEQYLSSRNTVTHVLCTSASDESILSGSSV